MTGEGALGFALGAGVGAGTAALGLRVALRASPASLMRTNVAGRTVPAVLGLPLVGGGALGATVVLVVDRAADVAFTTRDVALALLVVLIVAGLAGFADDRRGDEAARGFAGHLRAATTGRVTGGLLKILGVGLAALAAGLLTGTGWYLVEAAALIALSANLLNLLDRAPGRAAKVALLAAIPLVLLGAEPWVTAAGGLVGALLVCLVPDLRERAMLGDAGANPLGAALGLALALSLDRPGRLIALALLVIVNLASERWSFSRGIQRIPWLKALDDLGRSRPSTTSPRDAGE